MSSYPTYELLLDPTTFILVFIVLCTIYIGTEYHLYFQSHLIRFQNSLNTSTETPLTSSSNDLKLLTALLLPLFGSVFLLLLFYFLNIFQYLLIILFSFSSFFALSFTIYPLLQSTFQSSYVARSKFELFKSQNCSFSILDVLILLYSAAVTIAWLSTKYWILTDFIALNLAMTSLSFVRIPNLKIASVLLGLFFIYDIFWVFVSPAVFGKNVMVTVALSLPSLPILIVLPRTILPGYSILGLGDIMLPGLYICFLSRFDKNQKINHNSNNNNNNELNVNNNDEGNVKKRRYREVGMWGYGIGIITTLVSLVVMGKAQPALLWLVPSVIGSSVIEGWRRGELKEMWEGGENGEREIGGGERREEEMVEMGFVERGELGDATFVIGDEEEEEGNREKGKELEV
eukprot:TRINITY_DN2867_c1_g6_i1.p1 TRINITY_DN2867_c1_g6~~TRINITY_DN2867_c1_g6_i1.p1  ORF type:complete len:402 (-),score=118.09 TRINITY_DN2867_c1_g6_i1:22-1227(-)